ncbi:MAG: peptidoglycan DD-metalloendopeptidase family protein [Alphaproteobacteria bacterium]|nr:peptidoglycan DD-metalloendopeptidase family protein [Alphaproteobacteria bacterium]
MGFWHATSRPVPSLRQAAAAKAAALALPRDLWMIAASAVAIILMAGFAGIAAMATWTSQVERRVAPVEELPAPEVADTGPDVRDVTVERGDTLTQILIDEGAPAGDAQAAVSELAGVFNPSQIRAGQQITLTFAPADKQTQATPLLAIAFKPNVESDIALTRGDDGVFKAQKTVKVLTAQSDHAAGTIDGSLYLSAKSEGIPDAVIVDLIKIFSYDVDFQREIRSGDKFELLYTNYYDADGQVVKGGDIAYAALTLSGHRKELYRFTPSDDETTDYFTAKGWSGKRMLMKTPIDGARITSSYGMRFHPVLGYTRMHRGVDFGAPVGTPVMASGNGVVEFVGWHGGHGKYIRIRNAAPYKTAYGHLSRYARGLKVGMRVRQGQIIAYVGSTGVSTGPHLHYEVLVHDAQVNPLGVKLPTGRNLEGKELAAFKKRKADVDALIASLPLQPALVAQRTAPPAQPIQARALP